MFKFEHVSKNMSNLKSEKEINGSVYDYHTSQKPHDCDSYYGTIKNLGMDSALLH